MTFCSVATSSSTTSSWPARMSSTTHDVLCEQFLVERIERRLDGADLREDVDAVAVILDHLADAADLSLDAPQARDEALVFLAVLVAVLVLDATAAGVLLCTLLSHSSRLTFLIFT